MQEVHLASGHLLHLGQSLDEVDLCIAVEGVDQVVHDGDLVVHDVLEDSLFILEVQGDGLGAVFLQGFGLGICTDQCV